MKIYLDVARERYFYEMKSLLNAFFLEAVYVKEAAEASLCVTVVFCAQSIHIKIENKAVCSEAHLETEKDGATQLLKFRQKAYMMIREMYGVGLDWGILTGVRPVKIAAKRLEEGMDDDKIVAHYRDTLYVKEKKARLCVEVAHRERAGLAGAVQGAQALYVHIPICPQRCHYCSFVSLESTDPIFIDAYLAALEKEAICMGTMFEAPIDTVYIGGGTPAVLNAEQITRLIAVLKQSFDLRKVREFTFEAGRADVIDGEKIDAAVAGGVDRVCVNAQSMNASTLRAIGRDISPEMFCDAYDIVKKSGVNINVDLIYGLKSERDEAFLASLAQVIARAPHNITMHAMAYKKQAPIFKEKEHDRNKRTPGYEMAYEMLRVAGYAPYYLYRQKYAAGGAENVGFCLRGHEGIYNQMMISEKMGIIAIGAGALGKIYWPKEERLERIEGVKNIDLYIKDIDGVIEKKRKRIADVRENG